MNDYSPQYHFNPSQRTPCMLVLDASGSMEALVKATGRRRIDELNQGMRILQQALRDDDTAATRVQIATVCVGGPAGEADLVMDWTDALDFHPVDLMAGGLTPLGQGMQLALQHVQEHKRTLHAQGIPHTRPWVMVISDGSPTDDMPVWRDAVQACRQAEQEKRCLIFPIAVGEADVQRLQELSSTPVARLSEARFKDYFVWLSASLSQMSRSRPGDDVQLPATDPWRVVGG